MTDINQKLVKEFLNDPHLWNNLDEVLKDVAKKDPNQLAILNAKIVSLTLASLNSQKREKQFALSQIYSIEPKKNPLLFFELFYATKELYSNPFDVLKDSIANQKSFKYFIEQYKKQDDLIDWRKSYDKDRWLDLLDVWLETNDGKKFIASS